MVCDLQIIMKLLSLLLYCNVAFLTSFVNLCDFNVLYRLKKKAVVNSNQMMQIKKHFTTDQIPNLILLELSSQKKVLSVNMISVNMYILLLCSSRWLSGSGLGSFLQLLNPN